MASIDMDVDNYTERYDISVQPRPKSVVYTGHFTQLLALISKAVALILSPLEQSTYKSPIIDGLVEEVKLRSKDDFSELTTIGIKGKCGSGKSTLLNCILGVGMIARKVDSGDSQTWVPQNYRSMFPTQTLSFAAKVYFYDAKQIRNIVSTMLATYYKASTKGDEGSIDEEVEDDDLTSKFTIASNTVGAFRAL